jgi:hypothetical protein
MCRRPCAGVPLLGAGASGRVAAWRALSMDGAERFHYFQGSCYELMLLPVLSS